MNDTERPSDFDVLSDELRRISENTSQSAAVLYAAQKTYGAEVRAKTRDCYGRLSDAHMLVVGVLGSAILRTNGKIAPATSVSEALNALYASFVIGLDLCEVAIEEGRYIQAGALLRQEMETVAQIKAVRDGKRNEEGAPNVSSLREDLKRLYGGLSAAAHVSKHHVLRAAIEIEITGSDLPGPTSGTRHFPAFDGVLARKFFCIHIMLIANIIEELSVDIAERLPDEAFTLRDQEAITQALSLMRDEGMVEFF